jgi:hypothetical protein
MITWDPINKGSGASLSNKDLTAVIPNYNSTVRANKGKSSGKWYWEISFVQLSSAMVGIVNALANLNASSYTTSNTRYYYNTGPKYPGALSYGPTFGVNDVIGVAIDLDIGTLSFYKNGVLVGVSHSDIISMGLVYPAVSSGSSTSGNQCNVNFGDSEFLYGIPDGYSPYGTGTHLVISNGKYYTYKNKEFIEVELTEANFIQYGVSLFDLINSTDALVLAMPKSEDLSEGALYKLTLDTGKYGEIKGIL